MTKQKIPKYTALAIATSLLGLNFWAWSLVSPLANTYAAQLGLDPIFISLLVAIPVLVGSLARIPFGLLADRYGGRNLFALLCILTGVASLMLIPARSYPSLLVASAGLGVAGASFAVGVPFVNAWFPKKERGLALGIYAVGNAGTAVSGLLTPKLAVLMGHTAFFAAMAVALFSAGIMMYIYGRNAPGWHPTKAAAIARLGQAARWKLTWRLSALYAVTFGAFIALGTYLPILLHESYALTPTDAAARAAGFVLLATLARPIGGLLSDKLGGLSIVRAVFFVVATLAVIASTRPSLMPLGTIAYLGMAAALGAGNGAVFAIIGHRCDAKLVGTVTGIVGAAGGLGGFFPPLVMGMSYQLFQSYAVALGLLAAASFAIFIFSRRLLN